MLRSYSYLSILRIFHGNVFADCLSLLLEKGGNVNVLRDDQLSPVHLAAANGHTR